MDEVWNEIDQISDEVGEIRIAPGYLLKYEGWGGSCVEKTWFEVQDQQKADGIDIESEEADDEREQACCDFAGDESSRIIDQEWKPEMMHRHYVFVDGGYERGGLYGRTWALFRRRRHRRRNLA